MEAHLAKIIIQATFDLHMEVLTHLPAVMNWERMGLAEPRPPVWKKRRPFDRRAKLLLSRRFSSTQRLKEIIERLINSLDEPSFGFLGVPGGLGANLLVF